MLKPVWLAILPACLIVSCAAAPEPNTVSVLDEKTGITVTVVDEPLVLARDRREQAANARDYLTVVGVARNEAGKILRYLLVHRWTTIDERNENSASKKPGTLVLLADGRDVRLQQVAQLPRDFANLADRLWTPNVTRIESTAYAIDASTLKYLATSKNLSAWFDESSDPRSYAIWRDGRAALARFAAASGT